MLDIWQAYYQIEPWGNEWAQTASVLSMQSITQSMIAATVGQKMKPLDPIEFMPADSLRWVKRKEKTKGGVTDGKLQKQFILQAFGFAA